MPELCNSQLVESLAEALETMAFVSLMPPEQPIQPPSEAVYVQAEYNGPRRGRVELVASIDLGKLLVANTIACDPESADEQPSPVDALVELLNVTCGVLLRRTGPGLRFDSVVPRVLPFDTQSQWQDFISRDGCDVVLADGHVVAIRMTQE